MIPVEDQKLAVYKQDNAKLNFPMHSQKNSIRLLYYMDGVREGGETNTPWIIKFRVGFVDDDNLLEEYLNLSAWLRYSDSVDVKTCTFSSISDLNERKYNFPISPLNGFYQKIMNLNSYTEIKLYTMFLLSLEVSTFTYPKILYNIRRETSSYRQWRALTCNFLLMQEIYWKDSSLCRAATLCFTIFEKPLQNRDKNVNRPTPQFQIKLKLKS